MGNKCSVYNSDADAKFGSVNLNDSRHAMIMTSARKGASVQGDGSFYKPRSASSSELDISNSNLMTIYEDKCQNMSSVRV